MSAKKKIKRNRTPWPTKAAMEQVYANHLWGGAAHSFYSGEGSHAPELLMPYVEKLRLFFTSFEHPITVCDLGCGDFNVGEKLVEHTRKYTAVDIVDSLVAFNKRTFSKEHLEFLCLDIATDPLPNADCAIIRQVLQHISNKEISQLLPKLETYKYIIVTEHLPNGTFTPNSDIISGQGIRIKKNSGVDLSAAPFNFKAKKETPLLRVILEEKKGVLLTTLYELF